MGRVLIIAVAAVIGALGTWLFVPTVQPAKVNSNMPVFSYNPDPEEKEDTTVPRQGVISEEKRRARAEQLVGKQLKYITNEVHTTGWFNDQGVQVIERAMDECYLVTNPDLYLEHLSQVSDGGLDEVGDGDTMAALRKMQPTIRQAKNCANVHRAYAALHDIKVDF